MTTNKRFTIGDRALQEVYGGCIPAILDGGVPCTQSQVLKLLNELNEENKQLKQQNKELIKGIQDSARIGADAICKPMKKEVWGEYWND